MQEVDDMDLVRQAQAGQIHAVGELYDRHRLRIFRFIRCKVANTQQAQDLTSEVFLRMVNHLADFEPRGVPFTAWLYRIARNLIIQDGQEAAAAAVVPLGQAEEMRSSDNPAAAVEQQWQIEQVWQGLENLDPAQREVIVLRFVNGLSLKETAEALDRPVATIKTLQHRGILALQLALAYE
jgi:RNA polymerase sigma-70 factor (ECF subfamily)